MAKLSTVTVIAAAVAAYRTNGNSIITAPKEGSPQLPNRMLVDAILGEKQEAITVTEDDITQAHAIVNGLQQRGMIAGLKGSKVSEFSGRIIEIANHEEMQAYNIGVMVWAPKLHTDMQQADSHQHEFNMLAFGSKYVGKVKDKIEIDFTPIVVRYNTHFNVWRHTGHDGHGNLVGFMKKDKIEGTTRIKGCVKSQDHSRYTNGKTTTLNYVKVIK